MTPGTRVRNRITDETGTVVCGLPDPFGLIPVTWDEPPEGIYWCSPGKLEGVDDLRAREWGLPTVGEMGDPMMRRRAA